MMHSNHDVPDRVPYCRAVRWLHDCVMHSTRHVARPRQGGPPVPGPLITNPRRWVGSVALLAAVVGTGGLLAAWKNAAAREANAAAASQPEPAESVTAAVATEREHRQTTS